MAASKGAAARKGGGSRASKAKQNGQPETFKFRGLDLRVPEIPDTIAFDLADIQVRQEEDDGQAVLSSVHRLLESMFGREELRKVRPTLKGLDDEWQVELLNKALAAAKEMEAGEASASQRS